MMAEMLKVAESLIEAMIEEINAGRDVAGRAPMTLEDVLEQSGEVVPDWYERYDYKTAAITMQDGSIVRLGDATLAGAQQVADEFAACNDRLSVPLLAALADHHITAIFVDEVDVLSPLGSEADPNPVEVFGAHLGVDDSGIAWHEWASNIGEKEATRIFRGCTMFRRDAGDAGNG